MKKEYVITGAIYLLIGVLLGICAVFFDTKITFLLWGACGAGFGDGCMHLWKCCRY